MYKLIKVLTGIAIVSMFIIGNAHAAMSGGKHDLTDDTNLDNASVVSRDLCRYCHTPHSGGTLAPLWDRVAINASNFTMYSTPGGVDGLESTPTLTGLSGGCMSCHDGTTGFDAVNSYGGTADQSMDDLMSGSAAILGANLSDDHPIGVSYTAANTNLEMVGATPANSLPIWDGNVECASCHDVHDNTADWKMLRLNPAAGTLCGSCHNK